MKFTMQRDRTVASVAGHSIEFKKGVPTHVPSEMHAEVMAVGAVPEEDLPEADGPTSKEPTDALEREQQILMAIQIVAERNKREDFTASGAPHNRALATELGWAVPAAERDALWVKFQAGKDD